jgi:cobalt-zinc-cadmium efflux system outer membrane protein
LETSLDQALPFANVPVDSVPTLHAAVADSAAAAASARATSRARLPLPAVQAGAEWDDPSSPTHGALSTVGFSLPLPLWQRGGGAVAQARARTVEATAHVRETRLEVTRALREARIHLEETADRAQFARDSLLPAAQALGARALRAYQSGATGVLPVLDAIRGEREVALAAIQDLLAYQDAVATWYALLGRTD